MRLASSRPKERAMMLKRNKINQTLNLVDVVVAEDVAEDGVVAAEAEEVIMAMDQPEVS